MTKTEDPRITAWVVLVAGTTVTIIANVLHASDNFWARGLSASVPFILFFAAHTAAYAKSKIVRGLMIPVSIITLAISYDHINSLAMRYGESYEVAKLYPLAIDGAMVIATLCLALYQTPSSAAEKAPVDEVPGEEDVVITHDGLMLFLWPDNALALVEAGQKESVVRSQLNRKCRELGMNEVGASRVKTLIRNYEEEFVK